MTDISIFVDRNRYTSLVRVGIREGFEGVASLLFSSTN